MKVLKILFVMASITLSISCSQFTGASEHSIALDRAVQTMNEG